VDYLGDAGVEEIEGGLKLAYVANGGVGSRLYLLDGEEYYMMTFVNKEVSITYDVSKLGCGINGALYTVEMDKTGDMGGNNMAGAKYGTGYCDGQCPRDLKFVRGVANNKDVDPATNFGSIGYCCAEMDLWEANSITTAFTAHPSAKPGTVICNEEECGDQSGDRYTGQTDRDGCALNSWKNGKHDFYGPGKTIDTTKPFTVTTQFITSDGTDSGDLIDMKQFFTQNGNVVEMTAFDWTSENSLTSEYCTKFNSHFASKRNMFEELGGAKAMGESLKRGHVFVMSIWDDMATKMNWLDSIDGTTGIRSGPCDPDAGDPSKLRPQGRDKYVKYTDIRYGAIGSTMDAYPKPSHPTPPPTQPPSKDCKDDVQWAASCPGWAKSGQCDANPLWMKVHCKDSCGLCQTPPSPPPPPPPPCDDKNQNCPAWASGGECTRNKGWMLTNCKKSCGECGVVV
jgi:cellulose 1,4-beta-cellobiosidase